MLSDLVSGALGVAKVGDGPWRKAARRVLAAPIDHELTCDVAPSEDEPTEVRLQLKLGTRVVDQRVVTTSWWQGLRLDAISDTDRLRRAAAATVVWMLAQRYRTTPASMHGIGDPRVLWLLNEARIEPDPEAKDRIIRLVARLEPENYAVQFALWTRLLRSEPPEVLWMGEPQRTWRMLAIEETLTAVAADSDNDPTLQVRAMYNAAACAANSGSAHADERAHRMLIYLHDHYLMSDRLPREFTTQLAPTIRSALDATCRATNCILNEHVTSTPALLGSPRALYNRAAGRCNGAAAELAYQWIRTLPGGPGKKFVGARNGQADPPTRPSADALLKLAVEANPTFGSMVPSDASLDVCSETRESIRRWVASLESPTVNTPKQFSMPRGATRSYELTGRGLHDLRAAAPAGVVATVAAQDIESATVTVELGSAIEGDTVEVTLANSAGSTALTIRITVPTDAPSGDVARDVTPTLWQRLWKRQVPGS